MYQIVLSESDYSARWDEGSCKLIISIDADKIINEEIVKDVILIVDEEQA